VQPRIIDDEIDDYCAMVVDAWSESMKFIDGTDLSPEMGRELEREGEFWARRGAESWRAALLSHRGCKTS
jgi:hypothetical protein